MPREAAGQHRDNSGAHVDRSMNALLQLAGGPFSAGIPGQARGTERFEHDLVGRMHRQYLTCQEATQLARLKTHCFELAPILITIGFGLRRFVEVDDARIPGRDLDTFVPQTGNPFSDVADAVVRLLVPHELCEENCRALDAWHFLLLSRLYVEL